MTILVVKSYAISVVYQYIILLLVTYQCSYSLCSGRALEKESCVGWITRNQGRLFEVGTKGEAPEGKFCKFERWSGNCISELRSLGLLW